MSAIAVNHGFVRHSAMLRFAARVCRWPLLRGELCSLDVCSLVLCAHG